MKGGGGEDHCTLKIKILPYDRSTENITKIETVWKIIKDENFDYVNHLLVVIILAIVKSLLAPINVASFVWISIVKCVLNVEKQFYSVFILKLFDIHKIMLTYIKIMKDFFLPDKPLSSWESIDL